MKSNQSSLYCDGACSGNPGPGGFGFLLLTPTVVLEGGGFQPNTTNNQMELQALIRGLEAFARQKEPTPLLEVTLDSQYVLKGATEWLEGWKKREWKTAQGDKVANQAQWEELDSILKSPPLKRITLSWKWQRGHQGQWGNERVDAIAAGFSKGHPPELYVGPPDLYPHQPPKTPASADPLSFELDHKLKYPFYLAEVSGNILRYPTWNECEANVKGRSGARFKKISTRDEEVQTLKKWKTT